MSARQTFRQTGAAWICIALAAACAVSPLWFAGVSCGHDLSFHLLNWMEVASQWQHGVVRPFWCFHAAWNAGEPRFVFYPPLSWALGALLGLVLPWAAVPAAFTFVALLLCGLTMYRLLRECVKPQAAVLGACLFLANPYALFTAMERTAYAELLAAAWMPLLPLAVLRTRIRATELALPVALLWLTNAPAAVVGSYALLLLALVRCAYTWRQDAWREVWPAAWKTAAGYLLGLGVSAMFLLPAIVQRKRVAIDMALLPAMQPTQNFLFHTMGEVGHDTVLHQASVIAMGILGVGLAAALWLLLRPVHHVVWRSMHDRQRDMLEPSMLPAKAVTLALGTLLVAVLLLLLPVSAPLWRHAPELRFLQFPWRFLCVASAASVVLVVKLLPTKWNTRALAAAGVVIALTAGWATRPLYVQHCDQEDTPTAQRTVFQQQRGSEPTDEYTPSDADNDALNDHLPMAWLATKEEDSPASRALLLPAASTNPEDLHFVVPTQPGAAFLVVRLRQFDGWQAVVDGKAEPLDTERTDGLVAIPLQPGSHDVHMLYRWTWDELTGTAVTTIAMCVCLSAFVTRRRHRESLRAIP